VPKLLQHDHHVRILVRDENKVEPQKNLDAEVAVGDLLQPATLPKAVQNIETVIHLAAFFRGATDEQAQAVNLDGTLALAQAAHASGVQRFVFASTNLVYGQGNNRPALEDDPVQATRAYPATKIAAEQALRDFSEQRGFNLCILRFAFVYGENDPHILETLPRLVDWHPAKRLHMVHHADIAQALFRAISAEKVRGIYNVADDAPISISELRSFYKQPEPSGVDEPPLLHPWEGIVNTLRIRDKLGYRPLYPTFYAAREAGIL
jgi:nucleoside-diphosphate-sugar epimerase